MRARGIKPAFFKNEELAELGAEVQILFIGLWCIADREGRLEDRPKRIGAEVMPYTSANIEDALQKLHNKKFIIRYAVDNNKYIQILNFTKHQRPHFKEIKSVIPAYNRQEPIQIGTSTDLNPSSTDLSALTPSSLTPSSLTPSSLTPSSLTPSSLTPDKIERSKRSVQLKEVERCMLESFSQFYSAYPRHEAQPKALQAWKKIKPNEELLQVILQRIAKAKQSDQWQKDNGQFIPLPATWLNQRRWEDETMGKVVSNKYDGYGIKLEDMLKKKGGNNV